MVFQQFQFVPVLTVRENVALHRQHASDRDDELVEGAQDLLDGLQAETGTALIVVSHDRSLADRFEKVQGLATGTLEPADVASGG